jgi:hypothetical protein
LAGASDENIEDVKTLAGFVSQWSQYLKAINYDLDKFKKESTAAHQFIANKMSR